MVFNLWTILIWILALQGLLLGIVVLRKATRHPRSNQLIAALLFIFFLACVGLILKEWQHDPAPWIQIFPFYHLILVGPILHLFVRSELEPGFQPSIRDSTHFIVGLWSFRTLLQPSGTDFSSGSTNAVTRWMSYIYDYGDVFVWLVVTSYLVLGLITYKNFKSSPRSLWIKQLLDLFVFFQFAIWLPIIALDISPFHFVFGELGISYEIVYLPLTVIIYWIGIKWLVDSPTLTFKSITKQFIEKKLSADVTKKCVEDLYVTVKKYGLYQHGDVTLQDLSNLFKVSDETVNYLLHQELGKTFEEFIDSIRVDQLLSESKEVSTLTFEQLALKNGFDSAALGAKAIEDYTSMTKEEIFTLTQRGALNK